MNLIEGGNREINEIFDKNLGEMQRKFYEKKAA